MVSRNLVFGIINGERTHQDRAWPDKRPVCAELLLLNRYVTKANEEWADNAGDTAALGVIRKIAAIAVRCMENNGAPPRATVVKYKTEEDSPHPL